MEKLKTILMMFDIPVKHIDDDAAICKPHNDSEALCMMCVCVQQGIDFDYDAEDGELEVYCDVNEL